MALRDLLVPLAFLIELWGCSQTPTQPTYTPHGPSTGLFAPACAPVQVEVHCTVKMWSYGQPTIDVTDSAMWMVADSYSSDGLTPSSVAAVAAPGRIVPLRQGNIAIHVRWPTGHVVAP